MNAKYYQIGAEYGCYPPPHVVPLAVTLDEIRNLKACGGTVDLTKGNYYEIKCGRGEWIARTMADAEQMAIDFNEGVS